MDLTDKIINLGSLCGIAGEYQDNFGVRRHTLLATYRALLTAMGVPWEEPEALDQEIRRRRLRPYSHLLEPVTILFPETGSTRVLFSPWLPGPGFPHDFGVSAEIIPETGRKVAWEVLPTACPLEPRRPVPEGFRARLEFSLPEGLGLGYYDLILRVQAGGREETGRSRLILAPAKTYLPEFLAAGKKYWGLNLPFYALKSGRNWGIGDFTDLAAVTHWAGELGAGFVGINPMHAPIPEAGADPSPYSPGTRLFLNFLYLDLETVPELAACPAAQELLATPEFQAELARLRNAEMVAYQRVYRLKRQVLKLLHQTFQESIDPGNPRRREFRKFLAAAGPGLTRFAQCQALAEFLGHGDWRRWPATYHDAEGPAVAAFTRDHPREIAFHQYVQWLADQQLQAVESRSRQDGLAFSLYQDLALGAGPGGFEVWAHPGLFASGAAIGAPPDAFNPKGQNWGLPPLIPERLRESGYRLFIDTLRRNSLPGGMLRLDHVMGLFRLFWIPDGQGPWEGAYVYYPARELLAILALESVRQKTLIIGEDLGTVSPRIRRELARTGIFSYRVFYFERGPQHSLRPPQDYPRQAVAAVTTHDLPTLAGYWQGKDIELKRRFHLYPEPQLAEADARNREDDRRRLVEGLSRQGLLPGDSPPAPLQGPCPEAVRFGVLEYLAQSEAALLEIRLEEVFGLKNQQNLPGTTREHPNWRWKLPGLEEMRQAPEAPRLAARLNKYRGR